MATLEEFSRRGKQLTTIRFTAEVSNDKHAFSDTPLYVADYRAAVDIYT